MTSAASEKQIRKAQEQAKRDRLTEEVVTRTLMSTRDGRRWVWLRLEEAQIFSASGVSDHAQMGYDLGWRNAGLRLLRDVNRFCPKEYITMTTENTGVKLIEDEEDGVPDTDS